MSSITPGFTPQDEILNLSLEEFLTPERFVAAGVPIENYHTRIRVFLLDVMRLSLVREVQGKSAPGMRAFTRGGRKTVTYICQLFAHYGIVIHDVGT